MRRFATNLILFALLQICLFSVLRDPVMSRQTKCIARTIEKHLRLEKTPPPRAILVGGSNVSFGFDSQLLEEGVRKPVINMGLAAGLGIEFMLNEVRSHISAGDTVLLSFEYDIFTGGRDLLVVRQLLEMRPPSIRFVPLRDLKPILTDFGFHWLGGIMRRQFLPQKHQPSYSLDAWDYARGDFDDANTYTGHHGKPSTFALTSPDSPLRARGKIPPVGPRVLEMIAEFAALCHARGARCIYTCPPQPPDLLTTNIEDIQRNIERLKEIPHLTVLDTPREHVYPLDQLFDVQYHLTKEGAARRTRLVVDRLRQLR